jgi:hypothetical protein
MGKSLGTMIVYYKIPRGRGQAMGGNVTDCDCPWERILKSCPAVWIFDILLLYPGLPPCALGHIKKLRIYSCSIGMEEHCHQYIILFLYGQSRKIVLKIKRLSTSIRFV